MTETGSRRPKHSFNLRRLRLSLKYRPKIFRLILRLKMRISQKEIKIKKLKDGLNEMVNKNKCKEVSSVKELTDNSTNTDIAVESTDTDTGVPLKQIESRETQTSNEIELKNTTKDQTTQTEEIIKKTKQDETKVVESEVKPEDSGWNINGDREAKSIAEQVAEAAQDAMKESGMVYVESAGMYYDYKTGYYYNSELGLYYHTDTECYYYYSDEKKIFIFHSYPDRSSSNAALLAHEKRKAKKHKMERKTEDDIDNLTKNLSQVSLRGQTALESVAKHHPPCMRVIVRETRLPKLRVGNLFIVTKDGGTIGREGEQHTILLRDSNVSRNHLDIQFDPSRNLYTATDLGSKNGTILNGTRMSESQIMSKPMEIVHGSTIQLGETKLLCHIHPGNDTCGHCEPGLLMEAIEKEKQVAYTRTCNIQKQHQLELARLKNKYAPQPLAIEETAYNDRAQARRETVGSSHHSEKTQSTDVNTSITPENKGFKLLEKMGWNKGEGLGKESQGETEPVPLISNDGKAGLGAGHGPPMVPLAKNKLGSATLRLATRTKMLKPPAKAFQNTLDDEEESE